MFNDREKKNTIICLLAGLLIFGGGMLIRMDYKKALKKSKIDIVLHNIEEVQLSNIQTHSGGRSPSFRTVKILYILQDKVLSYNSCIVGDTFFNTTVDFISLNAEEKHTHKVALLKFDNGLVCQYNKMIKNGTVEDYKNDLQPHIENGDLLDEFCVQGKIRDM